MTMNIENRNAFDAAAIVIKAMRSVGVAPIPRNYHLFYEAYVGSKSALAEKLAMMGSDPTQTELDELAATEMGLGTVQFFREVNERLSDQLSDVISQMQRQHVVLESYNALLGEASSRLADVSVQTAAMVKGVVGALSTATGETISQGKTTVRYADRTSAELVEVYEQLEKYKKAANTDSLTGLANRRAFDEELADVYGRTAALPLTALVMADVDHFKKVNDSYGHAIGDQVLVTVGRILRAAAPKTTFVARTGGEEFGIILKGWSRDEVMVFCRKLCATIARRKFRNTRTRLDLGTVTVSLGVAFAGLNP
nr:GGDEF domain-containing protein [Pseudorhizobium flavum]